MKRTFEIEFPDDLGPLWMNKSNLLTCLTNTCPNTIFTVKDVTGLGDCDPTPESMGPLNPWREGAIRAEVYGAVARGYCSTLNSGKAVDAELSAAIAEEVLKLDALK